MTQSSPFSWVVVVDLVWFSCVCLTKPIVAYLCGKKKRNGVLIETVLHWDGTFRLFFSSRVVYSP